MNDIAGRPMGSPQPLRGRKVLVTGASGQIAGALCKRLAADNEVWGIARFGDAARRRELEEAGVRTRAVDLLSPDYSALPGDFDHVLHLAAYLGQNTTSDHSIEVNAVATGRLISHFRGVDSVLVMSTGAVYRAHPDPWHRYVETDPLGDPASTVSPAYGISKVAQEAVAKFCAQEFGTRVVIARMNASYGPGGGMSARHLDRIVAGEPIPARGDPWPYSPIYEDDIADHAGALLAAATSPALVVNFGGDEVVTVQDWCAWLGELAGKEPKLVVTPLPGGQLGVAVDVTRRQSITGHDRTHWREGMRRMVEARLGR